MTDGYVLRNIEIYHDTAPHVGKAAQVRKTITNSDQSFFIGLSGNLHPLYVDEIHARKFSANGRIVFELILGSLATNVLLELCGASYRLAGMNLDFPQAAHVNDTILAKAEVRSQDKGHVICSVSCETYPQGVVVARGDARLIKAIEK